MSHNLQRAAVFDCLPDVVADPDRALAVTQELLAGAGTRDELAAVVLALIARWPRWCHLAAVLSGCGGWRRPAATAGVAS